jgi:hypothetical protein
MPQQQQKAEATKSPSSTTFTTETIDMCNKKSKQQEEWYKQYSP